MHGPSPPPQTPQCCGCDVWSLVVVLFALLCRHLPFEGANEFEVAAKILQLSYHLAAWNVISEASQVLVDRFTTVAPRCRIALSDVSAPAWFQVGVLSEAFTPQCAKALH